MFALRVVRIYIIIVCPGSRWTDTSDSQNKRCNFLCLPSGSSRGLFSLSKCMYVGERVNISALPIGGLTGRGFLYRLHRDPVYTTRVGGV